MHIGIAAPLATADLAPLLDDDAARLPRGYEGAPMLATLIGALLARGHRVSAFTLSSDLPLDPQTMVRARGPGLRVIYKPMRPKAWPPNGWRPGRIVDLYAFERRGLQMAIERLQPEVVHAHWAYEFAWAALRTRLPHVVTCHDAPLKVPRFYRGLRHGGYRWLRAGMAAHVLRQAGAVTTVSPYMAREIAPLCRAPVDVVPNPVSPDALSMPRQESPGRARVLMVSHGWARHKNAMPALHAFALLRRRRPEAELVACGAEFGPGEAAERWCLEQGLAANVRFMGPRPHAEVLARMAVSDVLLHPSLEESFGMVVAEAMAVGLPVVAGHASGAVPWVLSEAGRLVDVTDAQAITVALFELLDDPALRARLGRCGREQAAQRFSADAVAAAYEACYRGAIGGAAPRAQGEASAHA